ncbi:hypothetical protein M8C21_000931 [Ambrosia artemisiifolia]|uniref:Uncharacterized protein n=1 Tax=Ambrosia artemisiifolia TaxID=4212 RepID=A0AAD5BXZ3_AMBAR|nr:hypothetical protein M8C21_000931 [Ambrosia artemisiifolia]
MLLLLPKHVPNLRSHISLILQTPVNLLLAPTTSSTNMNHINHHSVLIPVALLLLLFLLPIVTESATRPGFVYTRNRGRCTPQYWSSRREAWPRMIPEGSTVSKVFGSRAYERYRYDLTLFEATSRNDDGENVFARLVKESTAALINSYTRAGYPYSAWEVKTAVIEGLVSDEAAAMLSRRFYDANRACN